MALLTSARRVLLQDAEASRVSSRTAWVMFGVPFVLGAVLVASLAYEPLFVFLTAEDSVLEWAQFACFALAFALAAVAASRLRREHRLLAVLMALFALGALFSAREEVSWGQRIFGFGTPEELDEVNHQGETNLHNITAVPVQKTFNLLQLLAGFYGSVFAIAVRARWRSRPFGVDLLLPALVLAPAFLLMFLYRLLRLTVLTDTRFVLVKFGELPELTFAAGLAGFAFIAMRRSRSAPAQPQDGAPPPLRVVPSSTPDAT